MSTNNPNLFTTPEPIPEGQREHTQVHNEVQPFDLGAPPAELPQGEWVNPFEHLNPHTEQPSPTTVQPVVTSVSLPLEMNPAALLELQSMTIEQQEIVTAWWPHIYGKRSEYAGTYVLTARGVLMHAEDAMKDRRRSAFEQARVDLVTDRKQRTALKVQGSEYAIKYEAYTKECAARNAYIANLMSEWRMAVAQKREALSEWDRYVNAKRKAVDDAKAYPAPVRPSK